MLIWLLSLLALAMASAHIRAEYQGPRWHIYLFKPLTTSTIILIAVLVEESVSRQYMVLIIAGLFFSLAGDIFLMLPSDQFVAGLLSFLIAHCLYIAAFVGDSGVAAAWWVIPFFIYAAIIYRSLEPQLGRLRAPVILYMAVISVMAWQAAGRWAKMQDGATFLAFLGAILFVISDSVLALNRFGRPFRAGRLLTLAPYYAAQWLIALSIRTP